MSRVVRLPLAAKIRSALCTMLRVLANAAPAPGSAASQGKACRRLQKRSAAEWLTGCSTRPGERILRPKKCFAGPAGACPNSAPAAVGLRMPVLREIVLGAGRRRDTKIQFGVPVDFEQIDFQQELARRRCCTSFRIASASATFCRSVADREAVSLDVELGGGAGPQYPVPYASPRSSHRSFPKRTAI